MSEIRDRVRKQLRETAGEISALGVREHIGEADDYIAELEALIGKILSIDGLAIVDREAKFPFVETSEGINAREIAESYGWVKEDK